MKKVLLSIAALFTVATYASAQETGFGFGPKVGINLSNQTLLDGDYKTGLTAGVFADYRFSNLFALSADVLYSRQGTKGEGVKVKTDNLNIPILANFYLVKGLAVKAGIQPGFLLKAKNNDVDVKAVQLRPDPGRPLQHRPDQPRQRQGHRHAQQRIRHYRRLEILIATETGKRPDTTGADLKKQGVFRKKDALFLMLLFANRRNRSA